ncbi:MAG: lipid-A-disaccharide synthase-related protein [Thermosynechococcaceae cyanobacterium]
MANVPPQKLLILSNGHGEDQVAVRIVRSLQNLSHPPEIKALSIVGEGHAYQRQQIPLLDAVQAMPSGGFIYMDSRQTLRDIKGGLGQLTRRQLREVRAWAKQGGKILAVGDIVPLLFAWWSGAKYAFVGTAKSDYYLRDDRGEPIPRVGHPWWLSASVYLPWERWLMQRSQCCAVFPRDPLTAQILKQYAIPVFDQGNPMMDDLQPSGHLDLSTIYIQPQRTVLLLPGSRAPEVYANWEVILDAIAFLLHPTQPQLFLGALAPGLDHAPLSHALQQRGWQSQMNQERWTQAGSRLLLTGDFNDCLRRVEVAIAMAGTATEQCVGLGLPVITIPGQGPQFTAAFAEAQARLLGASIFRVEHPTQVADIMAHIDSADLQPWQANGLRRMGQPGAAQRIAETLAAELL